MPKYAECRKLVLLRRDVNRYAIIEHYISEYFHVYSIIL